jgi:hypothetical protein
MSEVCTCGLEVKDTIWRCPHHIYRLGRTQYDSVSHVIRAVLPSSYDGIEPMVLENARLRGVYVDLYFSQWLLYSQERLPTLLEFRELIQPHFSIDKFHSPAQHAEDCRVRLERLLNWSTSEGLKPVAIQKIVHDPGRRVAGTLDLRLPAAIYDVKCVSELQPDYRLQLGAYAECDGGEVSEVGIIHVRKDRVDFKRYNVKDCRNMWGHCWNWYKTKKRLDQLS